MHKKLSIGVKEYRIVLTFLILGTKGAHNYLMGISNKLKTKDGKICKTRIYMCIHSSFTRELILLSGKSNHTQENEGHLFV